METFTRKFKPAPFVPTISFGGDEPDVILRGENMWIRASRAGSFYAEGFTGSQDISETIATKTLTGTLAWSGGSTTITGTGTAFLTELRIGCFVLGDGGAGVTQALVVDKVVSDTSFICSRAAKETASGRTAYVLPVLFPVGTDRGTCIRGNVLQFPKGHYLGVGDGTFRVNGTALNSTLALSTTPRFALFDPSAGTYTQDNVGVAKPAAPPSVAAVARVAIVDSTNASPINIQATAHGLITGDKVTIGGHLVNTSANGFWSVIRIDANNITLTGSVGVGVGAATGYLFPSQMRAGDYNVRVCAKSTTTKGFSQPTDVIAPQTITANQSIRLTFNTAMVTGQDAYDIYVTPFEDNATTTIEARYMGPWFLLAGTDTSPDASVTAADLIDAGHATGRESGTTFVFSFSDAEIQTAVQVLTFNNFAPVDAEFVDIISGNVMYFSCLGKGNTAKLQGTSPGPVAVPSKPSNPEAVFLNKAITMAGGDYIIGEFNAKSRIYALGQNTLQTLLLTTLEEEPITFRSLWNTGFRNPYNVAFIKEYLYGDSTQGVVRSVAGGDDSAMEFEFASDMRDIFVDEPCGHKLVAYDPKNKAVCFFYSGAERRDQSGTNYWVTIVRPFLIEKGIWNPPIVLRKTDTDFIVSGVATIGNQLVFLAGGRTSAGTIVVKTYIFDGGDNEAKDWYLAWTFSDSGHPYTGKNIEGFSVNGRFASSSTRIDLHGVISEGDIDLSGLATNGGTRNAYTVGAMSNLGRKRYKKLKWSPFALWTMRMSGSHTTTADRLDNLVVDYSLQGSKN